MSKNCEYKRSLDYSQPQNVPLQLNASQTILAGDLLAISAGRGSKAAAAATVVFGIADAPMTTGVRATGTLTFSGISVDNQTVTIGSDVYELTVDTNYTAGNIKVYISDTTADVAVVALANAINNNDNSNFWAVADTTGDTVVITAKNCGTKYNDVATTETCTNASWGAAVTASGTDTTVNGVAQTDNDTIPVLSLNSKSVFRMLYTGTRELVQTDLFTTRFDLVVSGTTMKLNTDDTTGGFLIPVAFNNAAGWVDVVLDMSVMWNA